jgi:transglutaminase-like putative cysteine protease
MRLMVDHVSVYRYQAPVRSVVQTHRLTPSACDGQKAAEWQVTVTGGVQGGSFRDGAGDRVTAWTVPGPLDEIAVTVRGVVETQDTAGILRGHRESVPPDAYLRDTPSTALDQALRALAASVAAEDRLDLCHALSEAVADAIAYKPGATVSATTAAEALALGQGVCQDHAHALIALARAYDIPARYVSGYLFTDGGAESGGGGDIVSQEAAHAWAEAFVPGLGWVGFDPANRCCPDARYIRLGSGFDARAAAPIRGIARGMVGVEALDVRVAVVAGAQQSQSQ